mmetsp:Transcript_4886/g.6338  ORF Transcript_4886/g.6338 Transcript_4886/m.6338 type:complete len:247 (+) Transcript_4886:117-857(+)|eukprot:CAMPEP_0198143652 /NCGR_PEP_ID=MMETSP1443-20131203/8812_1 /TAXON_ID=186043 /ORGANISM="Entomoneis sp., Strain CCMP2396" /LENGTH=246 /DNA_ID=CAMNT_0043806919 /DNA_START=77 /DNA_END=817 /DNA_ORIENTATION=+
MSVQDFWNASKSLIEVTEKHPFLVAMVNGTLDMESFRYYVIQDALYLDDFGDCLHRLASHKDIPAAESEQLHEFAVGAEMAEKDLHNSFFKQWNILPKDNSHNGSSGNSDVDQQMPNTLLYTSFLHRVVATRPHAEGLAALLPCFWVYMHVGKCMLKLRDDLGETVQRPPQFDAWIDMYAGEEFETAVNDYIALADSYCQTADAETLQRMQEHFVLCCKLEHMFWDQAYTKMEWPSILSNNNDDNK